MVADFTPAASASVSTPATCARRHDHHRMIDRLADIAQRRIAAFAVDFLLPRIDQKDPARHSRSRADWRKSGSATRARSEAPTIATDLALNMLAGDRNTLSLPPRLRPVFDRRPLPAWYNILPRSAMARAVAALRGGDGT